MTRQGLEAPMRRVTLRDPAGPID